MCGIAGILQRNAPVDSEVIVRMRDVLRHRGPDDAGVYVSPDGACGLGHRRLSIIDLSPLGHQPMSNEDGTIWITFNGEVYNFAELRSRLEQKGHQFRSRSDTEAIVHAYEEFGPACVEHLHGMFAFALWDEPRRRLFLARDRFGMKPLYYYAEGGRFAFASELKALTAHPEIPRALNTSGLYDYLSYRYVPTPKTIYRHIFKLPPAHSLTVTAEGAGFKLEPKRYWDIDFGESVTNGAEPRFRTALADAVGSHLVSDVPLGVFLSGGIDSSTVVGVVRRSLHQPAETFTVGFDAEEHSETPYARRVAEALGTTHHEMTATLGTLDEALAQVVRMYDEPFADGSAVPTHRVCELARRHVKVALSGDGGDELFAGYGWYQRWLEQRRYDAFWFWAPGRVREWVRRGAPGRWKTRGVGRNLLLSPLEQYLRNIGVFTRYEKQRLLTRDFLREFDDYDDVWQLRQHWRDDFDPLSAMQYLDIHTYLPDDILTKVDRASMAVSLEVRVPFLDHRFAEIAARLPLNWRWRDGKTKFALRHLLKEWVPAEILNRAKQGFSAPWGHWLQPAQVRGRLLDGALVRAGILERKAAASATDRLLSGGKAWALLVLDQWLAETCA